MMPHRYPVMHLLGNLHIALKGPELALPGCSPKVWQRQEIKKETFPLKAGYNVVLVTQEGAVRIYFINFYFYEV